MVPAFVALALATTPGPLQASPTTQDLGEIKAGAVVTRRFEVLNVGTVELAITDMRGSCGCATPIVDRRTLRPGERGNVSLEINTLSQAASPHRWTVTVAYTYAGQANTLTLEMTGRLVREVTVTPTELAFLGGTEAFPDRTITVTSTDRSRPVRVTGVRPSSPRIALRSVDSSVVTLGVAADCPAGTFAESVTIATDHPDYPELKVPVRISRTPPQAILARPSRVTLVAGASAVVLLQLPAGGPVTVEGAESSHPAVTVRSTAGSAALRVGLNRESWDGRDLVAEVRVKANGHSVVVPVAIQARD